MHASRPARRSREEIIAAVIRTAKQESRKTSILYGSSLNLKQVNTYLSLLLEKGLLLYDVSRKVYKATERGVQYLRMFEEFVEARYALHERASALNSFLASPNKQKIMIVQDYSGQSNA